MTDPARTRVLVVDDSAFARKVLREVLTGDGTIDVVGIARDGLDALEKIAQLSPDVVTLDLVMPELDGVGVLRELGTRGDASPRVVVVTMTDQDSALGVAALEAGAFDVVHKPTAIATDRLYELGDDLREKVRAASAAGARGTPAAIAVGRRTPAATARPSSIPPLGGALPLVVIGASTGGPQALRTLVRSLPADLPAAVAIALHIPSGYTDALAARLDADTPLSVRESADGLVFGRGDVILARGGVHLKISAVDDVTYRARHDAAPLDAPHHPSVDVLFTSAAAAGAGRVVGVVLTGMGSDGLAGAHAIREADGFMISESERSSVVYGMPRVVKEAGLANDEATITDMAAAIARAVGRLVH